MRDNVEGVGAPCPFNGVEGCIVRAWWQCGDGGLVCVAREEIPADDDCDGVDDDCDGTADDDWQPDPADCQPIHDGGCRYLGTQHCAGNGPDCAYDDINGECENDSATCSDGQDNNHDGAIDCDDDFCRERPDCEFAGDEDEPCDADSPVHDREVAWCPVNRFCRGGACVLDLPEDPLERINRRPNDDLEGARSIEEGDHPNLTVHANAPDFYELPDCENPGGMYSVFIYFQHERGNLDLFAYDGAGESHVRSQGADDDEALQVQALLARYIEIRYVGGGHVDGGQYDLTIELENCDQDGVGGGQECSPCNAAEDCGEGMACRDLHYDQGTTVCLRDCDIDNGCEQGKFCSEGLCQPISPWPSCAADGAHVVELRDGCGRLWEEGSHDCPEGLHCLGAACLPPGFACWPCQDSADCGRDHDCRQLPNEFGEPGDTMGFCLPGCDANNACPMQPVMGASFTCEDAEDGELFCQPDYAQICQEGDVWGMLCGQRAGVRNSCDFNCMPDEGCAD